VAGLISFKFSLPETQTNASVLKRKYMIDPLNRCHSSDEGDVQYQSHDCMKSGGIIISNLWMSCDDSQIEIFIPPTVTVMLVIEKVGIYHRLCEDQIYR
jgi:hypothetical protein